MNKRNDCRLCIDPTEITAEMNSKFTWAQGSWIMGAILCQKKNLSYTILKEIPFLSDKRLKWCLITEKQLNCKKIIFSQTVDKFISKSVEQFFLKGFFEGFLFLCTFFISMNITNIYCILFSFLRESCTNWIKWDQKKKTLEEHSI